MGSIDSVETSRPVKFERLCSSRNIVAQGGLPVCAGDVAIMPDGKAKVVIIRSDKSSQTLTLRDPVVTATQRNRIAVFLGRVRQSVWDLFQDRRGASSATSKGAGDDPSILGVRAGNGLILRRSGAPLMVPWRSVYPARLIVTRITGEGKISRLAEIAGSASKSPMVTISGALAEPGALQFTIVEKVAPGVNKTSVFSALVVPPSTGADFLTEQAATAMPDSAARYAEAAMLAGDSDECRSDPKTAGCGAWRLEAFQVAERLSASKKRAFRKTLPACVP